MKQLEGEWLSVMAKTTVKFSRPGNTLIFEPGAIFNTASLAAKHSQAIPGVVEPVDLAELTREAKFLGLIRPGELGDVLVALAAARILKRVFTNLTEVAIYAHSRFHPVLAQQDDIAIRSNRYIRSNREKLMVDFTGYFEVDHQEGATHVPRLCRVLWPFGVGAPGWPVPKTKT